MAAVLVFIGMSFAGWLIWAGIKHTRARPFDEVYDDGEETENE